MKVGAFEIQTAYTGPLLELDENAPERANAWTRLDSEPQQLSPMWYNRRGLREPSAACLSGMEVLLYELEEKLIKQVAFLVSCLHCWRIETKKAELYKQIEALRFRVRRAKDAELLVNTQKFNEHLAKLEAFHDEKLQSAAAERLAKRRSRAH
eukprot:2922347-Amphidinium_carterae.1